MHFSWHAETILHAGDDASDAMLAPEDHQSIAVRDTTLGVQEHPFRPRARGWGGDP